MVRSESREVRTVLPDVRTEHTTAGGEDDVSSGVVVSELHAAVVVDDTRHGDVLPRVELALSREGRLDEVQHARTNLGDIHNLVFLALDLEDTGVVLLTTGSGVEGRAVEDDYRGRGALGGDVGHDFKL